jgi:hypothetical protein
MLVIIETTLHVTTSPVHLIFCHNCCTCQGRDKLQYINIHGDVRDKHDCDAAPVAVRDAEMQDERITVPQGTRSLLGDIFRKCGVEVHYCHEDKYDTIVAHAVSDDAHILGQSLDYFRYRGDLKCAR